jgi:hypothetical protein
MLVDVCWHFLTLVDTATTTKSPVHLPLHHHASHLSLIFHSHLKCRLPYTLWCFIEGAKTVFKVDIPIDSDIDDLKDSIKQKSSPHLDKFDAADLILWKVCYFW